MSLTELSLEIMMGMLLVALILFLNKAFIFLIIPIVLWWHYLHGWKIAVYLLIIILVFCGITLCKMPVFQSIQQGEIVYLSYSGFQIGETFYQCETTGLAEGDILKVKGTQTDFPRLSNVGGFDEKHFLMGKGIRYIAYIDDYEVVGHRWYLRQWAIQQLEDCSNSELKDIYQYVLLGIKDENIKSLTEMAKELAILHLFAISGMHFEILKKMFERFLKLFFPDKISSVLCFIFMSIYACMLRGNIAAWRAYLMMILKATKKWTPLQCFGMIGCFFLVYNPQVIFNASFIYSMSIYFLVTICGQIKASSIFVFIGSMLVGSYFQYEIVPLGYLAGLFFSQVIPYVFPMFVLDILLPGLFTSINLLIYKGMIGIMQFLCQFSISIVTGRTPLVFIYLAYLSLVYAIYQWRFYYRKSQFLLVICMIALILVYPYSHFYGTVTMIDVDQGDCFLIQLPFSRANILIDTGGLDYQDVALKRIIPFLKSQGIHQLDAVYLSHEDFDHCGALESLKASFKIKKVIWSFDYDTYAGVTFRQLNDFMGDDSNDNSQVIQVKLGNSQYLFTGDVSDETETRLLERYPNLKTDILKVAHHGSETASSIPFLSQIHGKIALVSVGRNNRYHHPSKKVINRLEAYGYEILRTDQMGMCRIYFTNKHTWIEKN